MKLAFQLFALVLVGLVLAEEEDGLPLAEPCNEELCKLPDCRCASTQIPGGLAARDTPQLVTLTFDDGVNVLNIETYRDILYNRVNQNGCKAGTTFYINHEYTNYQLVNELYNQGYEIALHSITHQTPSTYWEQADYETILKEFGDQRRQMAHFANIPISSINGIRSPFLQMSGNHTFQMLSEVGMVYDSSWGTINNINPGLWPYTLDYATPQECLITPCPNASIPGVWVQPMISWTDLSGNFCSMADACFVIPESNDDEGWFQFILRNFERHYLGNRAPFGLYYHEAYFTAHPGVRRALIRFLDLINTFNDVFMVNAGEVIDWVKDPIPINEYIKKPCRRFVPAVCRPSNCGPLSASHTEMQYYIQICNTCPRTYPWVGNPLGA